MRPEGLECVLMQGGRVIVYAFHQLKKHKTNYPTYELELVEVECTLKIGKHYLYRETWQLSIDNKILVYLFT